MSRSLRPDLEGLRAVAVLGVVIYHLRPAWLPGGFVGVDVFFVLSGFLITGLLVREAATRGRVDLLAFWGRRARRLLPAAGLVLLLTVVAGLVLVDALDARRFAADGGYAALFSVNWHYAAVGTSYLADPDPSPLIHYWSLGVEEQFYLVWPVIVLGVALLARRVRVPLAVIAAVVLVVSFTLAWRETAGLQSYAYFATYARVWQLALGALIALAAQRLARLPTGARPVLRWVGVGAVTGFYVLAPLDIVYPGWFSAIPAGGAALVIMAGLPMREGQLLAAQRGDVVNVVLVSPPAQLLGRYSYGWYLWHWPPLVLVPLALGRPLRIRELALCAVLTLAAAVVSYHLLEHPLRTSRVLAARRGRWSLALGAAIVLAGVGSAAAVGSIASWRADHTHIEAAGRLLTPQPGPAAAELPRPTTDGCEVDMRATSRQPECRYLPATRRGDVVLVGDSHAAQWASAVETVARSRHLGLRVWTHASCPLADISKYIDGAPSASCNAWRDDVMLRLLAARPTLVIVSGLASYVPQSFDRTTGKLVKGKASEATYEAGLRRELTRLRAAGISVLLIRDNPSYVTAGPKCALEHPGALDRCSLPAAQALRSSVDRDAASAVPGVAVLDNTDVFCDAARCHQVVGNVLAYRDNNHLTLEMITMLTPRLDAAVRGILQT